MQPATAFHCCSHKMHFLTLTTFYLTLKLELCQAQFHFSQMSAVLNNPYLRAGIIQSNIAGNPPTIVSLNYVLLAE